MSRTWSKEDRQRFADRDRLRAQTVPSKRHPGPSADEWTCNHSWRWSDSRNGFVCLGCWEFDGAEEI